MGNNKGIVRPIFNHIGNKFRIMDELLEVFEKYKIENFVDVFGGSGVVTANFDNAKNYYINDNDNLIFEVQKYILETNSKEIISDCQKIVEEYNLKDKGFKTYKDYAREYKKLRSDFNKYFDVRKLLVLILLGFNQQIRVTSKGGFNIPNGRSSWSVFSIKKILDFKYKIDNKNIEWSDDDFENFCGEKIENLDLEKTLFYFDPPYLISSKIYNEKWNDYHEEILISILQSIIDNKGNFVLSNLLESKGNINKLLEDFLKKNKEVLEVKYLEHINYNNSSYHRNNDSENKDVEVLVYSKIKR